MKKLVIDVSKHNGLVDWAKVAASGVYGVMVRIGWAGYEGELHIDERAIENITRAYGSGLKVGLYVYAYNRSIESAKRTADEIAAVVRPYKDLITLPVAFDIEDNRYFDKTRMENAQICLSFLNAIENLGFKPMLYSYTSFINHYLNIDLLSDYPLWIADYRDETGTNCPYKGKYIMWQYIGDKGRTDGVAGGCDRNWLYLEEENPLTPSNDCGKMIKEIEAVFDKYR